MQEEFYVLQTVKAGDSSHPPSVLPIAFVIFFVPLTPWFHFVPDIAIQYEETTFLQRGSLGLLVGRSPTFARAREGRAFT